MFPLEALKCMLSFDEEKIANMLLSQNSNGYTKTNVEAFYNITHGMSLTVSNALLEPLIFYIPVSWCLLDGCLIGNHTKSLYIYIYYA